MRTAPHLRILVIDDKRAIHEDFRKILGPSTSAGIDEAEADFFGETSEQPEQPAFEIDSAYQGEEGIELVRRALAEGRPYAVAFIDVRMPPGIDGIETTAQLWKLCPELQVVICTAYSDYSWQKMIAHDLNNVLAPIVMATPMLRAHPSPEKFEKTLAMIEVSAERATSVVHRLLTFVRGVEAKRVALRPADLLAEMEKIARETFPRSIQIERRQPADLWLAHADPTQLHQVLMNLCLNARDAMPQGGTLTIEAANFEADAQCVERIPGARLGRYVVLRVSDTGTGMPRSVVERMFDPFFTTKPLGRGTGLGLSTVVGIVKSHEGFLEVRSEPEQGSTFEIYLPAAETTTAVEISGQATPPARSGELVLVVDDESVLRDLVEIVLNEHGYRTVSAADGADAVTVYLDHAREIRAVLTDIMMPVSDGVALCRALRGMDVDLPIIACSGNQEETQTCELRSLNVHRMLRKPYLTRELLATLHEALS